MGNSYKRMLSKMASTYTTQVQQGTPCMQIHFVYNLN